MVYCLACGSLIEEWDSGYYARQMLCIPCWDRKQADARKKPCRRCGMRTSEESGGSVRGSFYCGGCKREAEREISLRTCFVCKKYVESWEQLRQAPDGKPLCEKCYASGQGRAGAKMCSKCGKVPAKAAIVLEGRLLCESCYFGERERVGARADAHRGAHAAGQERMAAGGGEGKLASVFKLLFG